MEADGVGDTSYLLSTSAEREKVKWHKQVIVIPLFVYFFASTLSASVYTNLILYKTCTQTFGYNETICTLVVNAKNENVTKELEELLQPYASNINMIKQLVEGIFPAVISLFLGSWSDANGRKPLIIFSLLGYLGYSCMCIIFSQMDTLDPWYLIIPVIPFSITGGLSALVTGSACYVSDITKESERSFRMLMLEAGVVSGILLGSFISPYLFNTLSYIGIFTLSTVMILLGTLYSVFFLQESVQRMNNSAYSSMLDFHLITEMVKTCFKKRQNYRRMIICLILTASTLGIFIIQGDSTVNYLFTREKFDWKLEQFTHYTAYSIIMVIIGIGIITMLLQKILKCSDGIISIISYSSAALRSFIIAFAINSWQMYFGETITCLRGVSNAMNRAILTQIVPSEDAGKVLSFATSLESIVPLTATPIYNSLYKKTLLQFPGAYNILTGGVYVFNIFTLCIVEFLLRRNISGYNQLSVEES